MRELEKTPPGPFSVEPRHDRETDCLTVYVDNVPSYEERVDDLVTVFVSIANNAPVGCQIKGVRRLLE